MKDHAQEPRPSIAWLFLPVMFAAVCYAFYMHANPIVRVEVVREVQYVDREKIIAAKPVTVEVEKVVEKIVDRPIILTVEKPVEKIVRVEVPVEKIVYRELPAPEPVTVIEYVPVFRWRR